MSALRNFPPALQPIISHGFLEREFEAALQSRPNFRMVAERVRVAGKLGETQDVDGVPVCMTHYACTTNLNLVTSRVGIASQFLLNAAINGEQAARSLDELARNALDKASAVETHDGALTIANLLNAVFFLRSNGVSEIDGLYNCYLDPVSARHLFSDNDFRAIFSGARSANQVFRKGMTNDFLGLRFIPISEYFGKPDVRRVWVSGAGAVREYVPEDVLALGCGAEDQLQHVVDDVVMTTREPVDRLQQFIAQGWYYVGEFQPVHCRAIAMDFAREISQ